MKSDAKNILDDAMQLEPSTAPSLLKHCWKVSTLSKTSKSPPHGGQRFSVAAMKSIVARPSW